MKNATTVKEWHEQLQKSSDRHAALLKAAAASRGKFIGTYPCFLCGKKVRVYDWLPEAVLCVKDKRDVELAEDKAQAPEDDDA